MECETSAKVPQDIEPTNQSTETPKLYGVPLEVARVVGSVLASKGWSKNVQDRAKHEGDETYRKVTQTEEARFLQIAIQKGRYDDWSTSGKRTIINKARSTASRRRKQKISEIVLSSLPESDRQMRLMAKEIVRLSTKLQEASQSNPEHRAILSTPTTTESHPGPVSDRSDEAVSLVTPLRRDYSGDVDNACIGDLRVSATQSVPFLPCVAQTSCEMQEPFLDLNPLSVDNACDSAAASDFQSWDLACMNYAAIDPTLIVTPSFEEEIRSSYAQKNSELLLFDHFPSAA